MRQTITRGKGNRQASEGSHVGWSFVGFLAPFQPDARARRASKKRGAGQGPVLVVAAPGKSCRQGLGEPATLKRGAQS